MSPILPEEPSLPSGPQKPGLRQRLSLPVATVALIAAVVTLVVALGVLSLPRGGAPDGAEGTATPAPTVTAIPSPTPTPTLPPGVERVIVARFSGSDSSFEVAQSVEGSLLAALASEGLSESVQVSRVPDEVTSHEDAKDLLAREGAGLVIWGRVEPEGVYARTTFASDGLPDLQRVHGDAEPLSIVFPDDLEFFLTRDLGTDLTFLSLATIGQLDLDRGAYDAARTRYESALLVLPTALPREARERAVGIVRFYYGLIALHDGDTLAALQDYSQTVRLYPNLYSVYNNRGSVYFALGDYEAALAEFGAALEKDPQNSVVVLRNQVLALWASGAHDSALLGAERLLTAAPDDPRSANLRGLLRYRRGDYEGALEDFETAAALTPESAGAQFNVAATLDALGRGEEAVEAYTRLLDAHPDDALALAYRGNAYLHQGLDAEAVTDYDEALKLDVDLVYAYQQRAEFYLARENLSVAQVDLETALSITDQEPRTYTLLGRLYFMQGDFEAATDAYDAALAVDPTYADALAGRGGVHRARRSFISARADLEAALAQGEPGAVPLLDLGLVYTQLGQHAEAMQVLQEAIVLAPDSPANHAALALALEGDQQREQAEEALRQALDLDPRFRDAEYLSGDLYWSQQAIERLQVILNRL